VRRVETIVITLLAAATVLISPLCLPAEALKSGGDGRDAGIFRVDVSRHPQIGFVVTPVDGASLHTMRTELRVRSGQLLLRPRITELSAEDLEVVVVPDPNLPAVQKAAQQAALARFVLRLPFGARSGVLDPGRPSESPRLSADPSGSTLALASPPTPSTSTAAQRLEAALAPFSPGPRTRRTVVLVTGSAGPERPTTLDHLRRRLAAGGVELFVLDLTAAGTTPLDQLTGPAGGLTVHLPAAGDADLMDQGLSKITLTLSRQFYVQVRDTAPLPHGLVVWREGGPGMRPTVVDLPTVNPSQPQRRALPQPTAVRHWQAPNNPLTALAVLMVFSGLVYGMVMLVLSRRTPRRSVRNLRTIGAGAGLRSFTELIGGPAPTRDRSASGSPAENGAAGLPPGPKPEDGFSFVFLLPCLNEEKVILASLDRLRSIPGDNYAIMVIDDASDDGTARVVSEVLTERLWLLQRHAPNARQGKGAVLNAAVRYLVDNKHLVGRDPDRVIIVVVDADGRLDPLALDLAGPLFADPAVGAVQIGVRINNRRVNLLARLQDMEFVIYTDVFQRGRRHLDSVGLGGNGQFMRLSALLDLGPAPWSRSLTEDLDLGIRLLAHGWRTDFCPGPAVHQQGIPELGRLIRQRTRWFQGHLQSWRLVPTILHDVSRPACADLLYHLSSPLLMLISSLLTTSFLVSLVASVVLLVQGQAAANWWLMSAYVLAFGPSTAYAYVYWTHERGDGLSLRRAWGLSHLYVLYGLIWYVSGWWAVARTVRGRTGWVKTERSYEPCEPVGVLTAGAGLATDEDPGSGR
jgi:1,2-diacylglycerol 3-beta-glucosyltransferase